MGGQGIYVRHEMILRYQEARASSQVGRSGSFFAARMELCKVISTLN